MRLVAFRREQEGGIHPGRCGVYKRSACLWNSSVRIGCGLSVIIAGACVSFARLGEKRGGPREAVPHLCGPELEQRGSFPRDRVRSRLVQEAMVAPLPQAPFRPCVWPRQGQQLPQSLPGEVRRPHFLWQRDKIALIPRPCR